MDSVDDLCFQASGQSSIEEHMTMFDMGRLTLIWVQGKLASPVSGVRYKSTKIKKQDTFPPSSTYTVYYNGLMFSWL